MCFSPPNSFGCSLIQFFIAVLLLALSGCAIYKLIYGLFGSRKQKFSYFGSRGPLAWGNIYPEALGKRQSPINVISDEVCCMFPNADSFPLTFQGYETSPIQYTLSNDGVKAHLTGQWRPGEAPFVTGGPLGCVKYFFTSLNFRWGPCNDLGSEHMLNYKRYPLELQLVHKTKPSPKKAESECPTSSGDSVCVISYFFLLSHDDNKYMNPIIHKLGRIQNMGSKIFLHPFPLSWLAPTFTYDYYTYSGSLTEPPCSEVAIWLLKFFPYLWISKRQLEEFRKLRSSFGPILTNSRPVQNLNGRSVGYYSS